MKARMESAPIEVDRIGCVCVRMARIVIIEHHLHNHVTRRRDHQWTAVAHGPTCCERGERLQGHEIVRIGGLLSIIAVVVGDDEDPVLRVFRAICTDLWRSLLFTAQNAATWCCVFDIGYEAGNRHGNGHCVILWTVPDV